MLNFPEQYDWTLQKRKGVYYFILYGHEKGSIEYVLLVYIENKDKNVIKDAIVEALENYND